MRVRARLENWLNSQWFGTTRPSWLLRALVPLYRTLRRWDQGRSVALDRKKLGLPPLIVVGNLTVGGTGKTPLVIWLVTQAIRSGLKPGVLSRGYLSKHRDRASALVLDGDSLPAWDLAGDEAWLIAARTKAPIAVCRDRMVAAKALASRCDVLICDDGLQNARLPRDIEILVIDGVREFGNRHLLPAGPLRDELPEDLAQRYPLRVVNGIAKDDAYSMQLVGGFAVNCVTGERRAISSFASVRALAGIGNPERFYQSLRELGVAEVVPITAGDHAVLSASDWDRATAKEPLLLTEKDAMKYPPNRNAWCVPIEANVDEALWRNILLRLQTA